MKNNAKLLVLLPLLAGVVTSCGGGNDNVEDNRRVLTVEFVEAGFGLKPYEAVANAFMKEHPDVAVKLVPNRGMAETTETRISNGNASDIMIYNRTVNNIRMWSKMGYVYDLTDVIKNDIVTDNKTIYDLMDDNAKNSSEYDGHFYTIPEYYGIEGFVYNATMFEKKSLSVPSTMYEFKNLCQTISGIQLGGKNVSPIVYTADADGYLYYLDEGITYAYEGVANSNNFYKFDSAEVYAPANSIGKKHGLTYLKDIYFNSNYICPGSSTMENQEAESKLMTNEAAMMLNGSWFENEISDYITASSPTFKMFAIPEVTDKNGVVLRSNTFTSNAKSQPVARAEFVANMFIPSCAKNKDDAVEYLKFTSRPDICELWTLNSNSPRPFNYNISSSSSAYTTMSEFGKSILDICATHCLYVPDSKSDLAVTGYATWRPQGYWFEKLKGSYTPDDCISSDYNYASNNWNKWVSNAAEVLGK